MTEKNIILGLNDLIHKMIIQNCDIAKKLAVEADEYNKLPIESNLDLHNKAKKSMELVLSIMDCCELLYKISKYAQDERLRLAPFDHK